MFVLDSKGSEYRVDDGLRIRAQALMRDEKVGDLISHVDIDQVIFLRFSGSKASWLGKCIFVGRAPQNIISHYVFHKLSELGMLDLNKVVGDAATLFDIRYLIVLNDDSISLVGGDLQKVEDGVLVHELMHINEDGTKLVKHDIEDFSNLVDLYGPYWTNGVFKDDQTANDSMPRLLHSSNSEYWTPEESD